MSGARTGAAAAMAAIACMAGIGAPGLCVRASAQTGAEPTRGANSSISAVAKLEGGAGPLRVADTLTLRVEVRTPSGFVVNWPAELGSPGSRLGPFDIEVVSAETARLDTDMASIVHSRTISLAAPAAGRLEIPAISVGVTTPDGSTSAHRTVPIAVTIESLLPAEVAAALKAAPEDSAQGLPDREALGLTRLQDEYAVAKPSGGWRWGTVVAVSVAAGLVGVGTYLWRRRSRVIPGPEVAAERRLREVLSGAGAGDVRVVIDAAAACIRASLAAHVDPRAVAWTGLEARAWLRGMGSSGSARFERVGEDLELCESASYSGAALDVAALRELAQRALDLSAELRSSPRLAAETAGREPAERSAA